MALLILYFVWIYFRRKTSRRYGVIECDALVRKGLEKSVSFVGRFILHYCKFFFFLTRLSSEIFIYPVYLDDSDLCLFFKQARHMVIPYMPMLVPPVNWTGYGLKYYLSTCLFQPLYLIVNFIE